VKTRAYRAAAGAASVLALSCGCGPVPSDGDVILAVVSIAPQSWLVMGVGGDAVDVEVLVPPGFSPATYEPTAEDLRTLSRADVYFSIGVPFEDAWMPRLRGSVPGLPVVQTQAGIQRLPIDRHSLLADGGEDHGTADPHIWLSPELARVQATTIADALAAIDPGRAGLFEAGRDSLLGVISDLQEQLHGILDPLEGSAFMVFHPSWGYFADEFGLVQIAIEVEGREPTPGQMAELLEAVPEYDIRVIFVSPQFSDAAARTIAGQTGTEVAVMDPLDPDWPGGLLRAAHLLEEARR
jgi:zinc transport system substrate-binding protein